MFAILGHGEEGILERIGAIGSRIGAAFQQKANELGMAFADGEMKRRRVIILAANQVGTPGHERLHLIEIAIAGGAQHVPDVVVFEVAGLNHWEDSPGGEGAQVAPAVAAVKLAGRGEEAFGSESFIEGVRRITRIAEQEHRMDPLREKAPGDMADEAAAEAAAVVFAEEVDLVQFAGIFRELAGVGVALGKPTSAPSARVMT